MHAASAEYAEVHSPSMYARRQQTRHRWLAELGELLAFPTVSANPGNRRDIECAARWLAAHLARTGLQNVHLLPGPRAGPPSIYADWLKSPGQPTVLLYAHYDVQPAGTLGEWISPPFHATVRDGRMYARGASDDKGQLFIHLKALETWLAVAGRLPINVKLWLEGEEEIGSPNLAAFLDREAHRLQADAVLVSDTEMPGPGRPSIVYGLRGSLACEIEVRGPRRDLHSGRYGGGVHNPLQALCEILAALHDSTGRVAIHGFYDTVREVSGVERQRLGAHAPSARQLAATLGIPATWGEDGYSPFERMTIRPSLNIDALQGGAVGPGGKAAIPSSARCRISMRLVPDQKPAEIARLLRTHLAGAVSPGVGVRVSTSGGSPPVVISPRHPIMAAAAAAVKRIWQFPPIWTRSGGTIPVVEQLYRRLRVPVVLLGFGLPDDNIHAANESILLDNLFRGVETVTTLFEELAAR